jgi:hypothetical protein
VATSATAAAATAQICQKAKVNTVERRADARAQKLARSRGTEASDGLRSPEPAISELEISWVSEEREELEEKDKEQEVAEEKELAEGEGDREGRAGALHQGKAVNLVRLFLL